MRNEEEAKKEFGILYSQIFRQKGLNGRCIVVLKNKGEGINKNREFEKRIEAENRAGQRINKTERSQEWNESTNWQQKRKKSTFTVLVSAIDELMCPAATANAT